MIMSVRDSMGLPRIGSAPPNGQVRQIPAGARAAMMGGSAPIGSQAGQMATTASSSFTPTSIDDVIRGRQGQAEQVIDESNRLARTFEDIAESQSLPLRRQIDMGAFDEQQALLGLSGDQAQRSALASIPQTIADKERNQREAQQLLRGMSVSGDVGSGAAILAAQQLGGQQQANLIQNRLNQLEPLSGISRSLATQVSQLNERARTRRANLEQSAGSQMANVRLGSTAPVISGIQQQASLSGLQGIASADARAAQNNQIASLAGQLAPMAISAFTQPTTQPTFTPTQSAGIPNAGTVGIA